MPISWYIWFIPNQKNTQYERIWDFQDYSNQRYLELLKILGNLQISADNSMKY